MDLWLPQIRLKFPTTLASFHRWNVMVLDTSMILTMVSAVVMRMTWMKVLFPNLLTGTTFLKNAETNCGLYIFYPIFHCGLYCRVVNITENLCTKNGNSLIFETKIQFIIESGFKSRAGYNGARMIYWALLNKQSLLASTQFYQIFGN